MYKNHKFNELFFGLYSARCFLTTLYDSTHIYIYKIQGRFGREYFTFEKGDEQRTNTKTAIKYMNFKQGEEVVLYSNSSTTRCSSIYCATRFRLNDKFPSSKTCSDNNIQKKLEYLIQTTYTFFTDLG